MQSGRGRGSASPSHRRPRRCFSRRWTAESVIKLRFWRDPWIVGRTAQQIAPSLWPFVRGSDKNLTVQEAIANNRRVRGIRGTLTVQAVVEFLELWELIQGQETEEEEEDMVSWRLTANGQYSSKSAYSAFFFGRTAAPCAAEIWSAGAPLSQKLHMWLATKNRL